jgi:putative Holliday junction resolvase
MRALGVDYGEKRIGLALSDALKITASPYEVLERHGTAEVVAAIAEIVEAQQVDEVVVGHPISLDGLAHAAAEAAEEFAGALRERLSVPVVLWDERLSTAQAERALLEGDVSRAGRKQRIDKISAAVVLQSYLDRRTSRAAGEP